MESDATNSRARKYVWQKIKKNYYDHGIRVFWLDEAEPEWGTYDFKKYRYYIGGQPVLRSTDVVRRYHGPLGGFPPSGLIMGVAGIPWWTTEIDGFHGGHPGV